MGIAISGPEFVLTYASGQWGTARESVKAFRASGYPQWTMRHGFFADMGGTEGLGFVSDYYEAAALVGGKEVYGDSGRHARGSGG
jgi:hypothetical protein